MGILGELPLDKGNVKVTGKLAYAAQQPWIFSASVRQNIIFGQTFDKDKYEKCVKAAALSKVITLFLISCNEQIFENLLIHRNSFRKKLKL